MGEVGAVRSDRAVWAMGWGVGFVLGWTGGGDESAGPSMPQGKVWKTLNMGLDWPWQEARTVSGLGVTPAPPHPP